MASIAAQGYSDALYEIAVELNKADEYREQLCFVNDQIQANRDFLRIMTYPKIAKEEKKQMLHEVFAQSIDHTMLNFLKLLLDKNRFQDLDEIKKAFVKRYHKEHNIVVAYVKSARDLSEAEIERLRVMLEKKLAKRVELRLSTDSELLAGIRVKVNDLVLDYSALSQMEQLKRLASASDQRKESECECE